MLKHVICASILFAFTNVFWGSTSVAQVPLNDGMDQEVYDYGEELLRGPVHEAFAEQYSQQPVEGLIVDRAPPPAVPEIPPQLKPEGDNIHWVSGYWFWDDDRDDYIWISGVWRHMPPGQRWIPGYWAELDDRYQWVGGTWVAATISEIEYIAEAPPETLDLGPVGYSPSEQHFWVPGCWVWNQSSYAWRPGYWSIGYSNWVWVPQRHLWTPGGYVLCNGYWDYPIESRGTLFAPFWFNRPVYRQAGFHYAPRLSLFAGGLQSHFWVYPRNRHYYFGDYYATNYRQSGIYPWHSYHLGNVLSLGSRGFRGYDPLFAHVSRTHAGRGSNITQQLNTQFNLYVNQSDRRPPQTYREQQGRGGPSRPTTGPFSGDRISRGQGGESLRTRDDVLGESIRESARRDPTRFTQVNEEQIRRYRDQAATPSQLESLRRDAESRGRGSASVTRSAEAGSGFRALAAPRDQGSAGRDDSQRRSFGSDILRGDRTPSASVDAPARWRLPASDRSDRSSSAEQTRGGVRQTSDSGNALSIGRSSERYSAARPSTNTRSSNIPSTSSSGRSPLQMGPSALNRANTAQPSASQPSASQPSAIQRNVTPPTSSMPRFSTPRTTTPPSTVPNVRNSLPGLVPGPSSAVRPSTSRSSPTPTPNRISPSQISPRSVFGQGGRSSGVRSSSEPSVRSSMPSSMPSFDRSSPSRSRSPGPSLGSGSSRPSGGAFSPPSRGSSSAGSNAGGSSRSGGPGGQRGSSGDAGGPGRGRR